MFPAKAKRVIFMYMQGAPSQYETFDYSPDLVSGTGKGRNLMTPAFKFAPAGRADCPFPTSFPTCKSRPTSSASSTA